MTMRRRGKTARGEEADEHHNRGESKGNPERRTVHGTGREIVSVRHSEVLLPLLAFRSFFIPVAIALVFLLNRTVLSLFRNLLGFPFPLALALSFAFARRRARFVDAVNLVGRDVVLFSQVDWTLARIAQRRFGKESEAGIDSRKRVSLRLLPHTETVQGRAGGGS